MSLRREADSVPRLADLKIWGPAGAGDPAPAAADPVKYTCKLFPLHSSGHEADLKVVPYENIVAAEAATANAGPSSPPPTFAAATTADGLMDRRNVVTDTSQGTPYSSHQPQCDSD